MGNIDEGKHYSQDRKHKTLTCYTCEKLVKDYHVSSHLFFGTLECRECHIKFRYCDKYYTFRRSKEPRASQTCGHTKLRFTRDPFKYLDRKLIRDKARTKCKASDACAKNVVKEMKRYLDILKPLENRSPWKHAIEKLKKHVSRKRNSRIHDRCASKKPERYHYPDRDGWKQLSILHDHGSKKTEGDEQRDEEYISETKENIRHCYGNAHIPQFIEETIISQTEWSVESTSMKATDECDK
ncbi:hypothetical protein SK128_011488, partial [Halocaridina rubra]